MDIIWGFASIAFIIYIICVILKDFHTKVDRDYVGEMLRKSIGKDIEKAHRAIQECYQWGFDDAIITRPTSDRLQIYYDKEARDTGYEFPNVLFVFWEKRPNAKVERDEVIAYVDYEGYEISIKAPQKGRLIRAKGCYLEVNDKEIICEIEPIIK